jgi:hypothetical protein
MRRPCLPWLLCGLFASACGSSSNGPTSPSMPVARTLRGVVSDPAGDAHRTSANPPDLTSATIEVANGSVSITVDYTPGSVSASDVYIVVVLDTDMNPATGYPGVTGGATDSSLIGGDYLISIPMAPASSVVAITRATSATALTRVGTTTVSFGATEAQLSFPLALLVGTDGHMAFKVVSAQYLNGTTSTTGVSDIMPDAGLPPGLVQ